tara:strand:- start:74146 stop:74991 length:846 start_codon:yes stop_codon:yes gene_type:complete
MCRFVSYIGKPLQLSEVIAKPKDSLIKQSQAARESLYELNGDGFGVAWYKPKLTEQPGLYKSIEPAWNDENLNSLAHHMSSSCFLAHVRAATAGSLSRYNCHPYTYKQYSFMHNGSIEGFRHLKRDMINMMPEELFLNIKGQTDSEHFFHLLLTTLLQTKKPDFIKAIKTTLDIVAELQAKYKVKKANAINLVLSDGKRLIAMRYSSNPKQHKCPTLYYSAGSVFTHTQKGCHMLPPKHGKNEAIIITSEKLTDFAEEWQMVEPNTIVMVDAKKQLTFKAI